MNILEMLTEKIISMENTQGIGLSQFKYKANEKRKIKKCAKNKEIKLSDLMRRT